MSWSFRVNNKSVLIVDDQGSPLARVQCLNDKDNVRIATEIVRASMRIEELETKVAELEAQNERLSTILIFPGGSEEMSKKNNSNIQLLE